MPTGHLPRSMGFKSSSVGNFDQMWLSVGVDDGHVGDQHGCGDEDLLRGAEQPSDPHRLFQLPFFHSDDQADGATRRDHDVLVLELLREKLLQALAQLFQVGPAGWNLLGRIVEGGVDCQGEPGPIRGSGSGTRVRISATRSSGNCIGQQLA